jgi:preprotein translocase subunit SecA
LSGLIEDISDIFPPPLSFELSVASLSSVSPEQIGETLNAYADKLYDQREIEMGADNIRLLERLIMLRTIDDLWKEHLTAMDHLRQKVGLESMRQIDPLVIYKKEGHAYFESLLASIQHDLVHTIFKASITMKESSPPRQPQKAAIPINKKLGRNDPCHCGSGKKYKHCCGN